MSYTCNACFETKEGKAWISIQGKDTVITACSYLCYKKHLTHIPTRHFHLILNPEDFSEPRPGGIQPIKEQFNFLTETEINELTNEAYHKYKDDLDEQFLMNPIKSEIYHKELQDDKHAKELEDEYNTDISDEEVPDDY